jgi:hypothetical protein
MMTTMMVMMMMGWEMGWEMGNVMRRKESHEAKHSPRGKSAQGCVRDERGRGELRAYDKRVVLTRHSDHSS